MSGRRRDGARATVLAAAFGAALLGVLTLGARSAQAASATAATAAPSATTAEPATSAATQPTSTATAPKSTSTTPAATKATTATTAATNSTTATSASTAATSPKPTSTASTAHAAVADALAVKVLGSSSGPSAAVPAGLAQMPALTDAAVFRPLAPQGQDAACTVAFNLDLQQGASGQRSVLCAGFNTRSLDELPLLKADQDGTSYLLLPMDQLPVPQALAALLADWSWTPAQAATCPWAWTAEFDAPNLGNLTAWLSDARYEPQYQADYVQLQVQGRGTAWYLRVPWQRVAGGSDDGNPLVRVGLNREAWVVNLFFCAPVEADAGLPAQGALMSGKVGSALQVRATPVHGAAPLGATYYGNGPFTRMLYYIEGTDGTSFSLAPLEHDDATGAAGLLDHLAYYGCVLDPAQGASPLRFSSQYLPQTQPASAWAQTATEPTSYLTVLGRAYLRMPSSAPVLVGSGQVSSQARYTLFYGYDYEAAGQVPAGSTFTAYADGLAPQIQGRLQVTDRSTGKTDVGSPLGTVAATQARQLMVRTSSGSFESPCYALVPVADLERLFSAQGYRFDEKGAAADPASTPFVACQGTSQQASWHPSTVAAPYFSYNGTWYLQVPAAKGVAGLYSDHTQARQVASTVMYRKEVDSAEKVRVCVKDPDGNGLAGARFRVLTATGGATGIQGTTDADGMLTLCADGVPVTLESLASQAGFVFDLEQVAPPVGHLSAGTVSLRVQGTGLALSGDAPAGVSVSNSTDGQAPVSTVTVVDPPAVVDCRATQGTAQLAASFALYAAREADGALLLRAQDASGATVWADLDPDPHNANLGTVRVSGADGTYVCDPSTGVISLTAEKATYTVSPARDALGAPLLASGDGARFSCVPQGTYAARQLTAPAATAQGLGPQVCAALAAVTVGPSSLSGAQADGVSFSARAQKGSPLPNLLAVTFQDQQAVAPSLALTVDQRPARTDDEDSRGAYGQDLVCEARVDTGQNAGLAGTATGMDADCTLTFRLSGAGLFVPDADSVDVEAARDGGATVAWDAGTDFTAQVSPALPGSSATLTVVLRKAALQRLGASPATVEVLVEGTLFVQEAPGSSDSRHDVLQVSLAYGPATSGGVTLDLGSRDATVCTGGFALRDRSEEHGGNVGSYTYSLHDHTGAPVTFTKGTASDGSEVYRADRTGTAGEKGTASRPGRTTSSIVTSSTGYVQVLGLAPGTYELRQEKAPAGHRRLAASSPIRLRIWPSGRVEVSCSERQGGLSPVQNRNGLITVSAADGYGFWPVNVGMPVPDVWLWLALVLTVALGLWLLWLLVLLFRRRRGSSFFAR